MQITNNFSNRSNYQVNDRARQQQNTSNPAFGMKVYTKEINGSSLVTDIRKIAKDMDQRFDIDGDSGKKIVKEWGPSAIIPGGSIFDKFVDKVKELVKIDDGKELFVFFGKKMPFIGPDSNKNSLTMILRDTNTNKEIASEIVTPKTTEFNNIFDTELVKLQENIKTLGTKGTSRKYFDDIKPGVSVLVEGNEKFKKMISLSNYLKKDLQLKDNEKMFITITPKHTIIELSEEFNNYQSVKSSRYINNNDPKYIQRLAYEVKTCQSINKQLTIEQSQNADVNRFFMSTDPLKAVQQ